MQQISNLRAHGMVRGASLLWLLCFGMFWTTLVSAQTSIYCPVPLTGTVANGGTVAVNVSTCDGPFDGGMSGPIAPFSAHGTVIIGPNSGGVEFVTYSHNGNSATSDVIWLEDNDLGTVLINITITPPTSSIVVAPASLPTLTAGTPFSQTLTSTGGTAPYTYTLSAGTLPVGLTLSSAGVLSGTPTQRGSYSFSVRSQDNIGGFVIKGYTGTVQNPTLSISPANATAGQGVAFSQALTASGGVAPHSYLLETGSFPAGISISSAGVISGTTAAAVGPYPVTLRVTDASTGPGSYFELESFTLNVSALPSLSINDVSITEGNAGTQVMTFTVTRTGTTASAAGFSFSTADSTATTADSDYVLASGTGSIPSGGATGTTTVSVTINGDAKFENNESLFVNLTAPTNAVITDAQGIGTITNDDTAPTLAINDVSIVEGNSGTQNMVFTVTRTGLTAFPVSFTAATANGTATAPSDYLAALVGSTSIAAGGATGTTTLTATINGDAAQEANETFFVNLSAPTNATISDNQGLGTINNDDTAGILLVQSGGTTNVTEGGASDSYTLELTSQPSSNVSIALNPGTQVTATTSPVVFTTANWNVAQTVTVTAVDDTAVEGNHTGAISHTVTSADASYNNFAVANVVANITDNDLPTLTVNDVSITEGNSGTQVLNFTVTRIGTTPSAAGFSFATADNTATVADNDYVGATGTGTIPSGGASASTTISVTINGDAKFESNESFFVNLTAPTNAGITDAQGIGTITNDDALPSLSINDVTVTEGNSGTTNAVFTVTLSAASGQTASVNYATADGTATQPADYTNTGGSLTFTPGQTTRTITVPVIGETVPEANDTFFVNLSGATNATISDNQGLGTISNDDVPVVVSPGSLPNGTVAAAYSQTITASGGVAAYSFTVTAGALPAGLTLNTGGLLSGTPTAGGSFNFTITATDSSPFPGPFSGSQAYTLTVNPATITLPATTLAGGTLGLPYSATINAATGGTAPRTYAVTVGALPGGLTLNTSSGAITGTPSALGTFNFSITATDSSTGTGPYSATQSYSIVVIAVPPTASNSSLTVAYNAAATNVPLSLGGGAPTSLAIGTAPLHGSAIVTGITITYQPATGYAGPDSFTYTATNSGGTSAPATVSVTVNDPVITITPSGGFAATVGTAYSQTFTFNGGAQPWSGFQVTNLPAGVSITGTTANSVTVSGTPTQAGSFSLNASATDSNGPYSVGQAFTLTVTGPALALAPAAGTLTGTYGAAYSQAFTASGGIGAYSYVRTGTLPAGVSFSGNSVSGTPTAPGSYSFTVTATDTGSTGTGSPFTIAQNYTLNVPAPVIVVNPATLPNPTAGNAYSQTLTVTGGVAPYSTAVSSGSLPSGITLTSGGALSGTSNQVGTFNITVTATDANGQTGSRAYTLTIAAPTLTMTPAAGTLTATYGASYTQAFTAAGSAGPFNYVLTGALPTGVSFTGNTLSGTPTVPGSYPITVTATDTVLTGVGAPFSITQNYTLNVPAPTIVLNPATLPAVAAGASYSQSITATGGIAPYAFTLTSGSLPTGVTLSASGALTGTPTQVGSFNITITATDANGQTGNRAYTLVVTAPTLSMTPAAGTLTATYGAAYTQSFTASGSPGPYSYALTGALPAGVTFSGNTISGTPTAPGSYPITVTATDTGLTGVGAPFSIARNYTLNVPAPVIVVNPATLPGTTAGQSYTQLLTATGGVAPYAFSLTAGSLPNGLTLSTGGALTGTTTTSGTFNFTVTATDANGQTGNRAYSVVVAVPTLVLSPATLPAGIAGTAYSQTLVASGGIAPYTRSLTGALPTGLSFNAGTGVLSGTPTQSGTFNISVTVTDSTGGTAATITNNYALVIAVPTLSLTPSALANGVQFTLYPTTSFVASGGVAPYSYSVTAGALPAGMTISATGALSGTPTASGTFNFTVRATDSTSGTAATISRAYQLVISNLPDPSKDAEVRGLIESQIASTRRFADAQVTNFQQHMEGLHSGSDTSGFDNKVGFSGAVGKNCKPDSLRFGNDACERARADGMGAGLNADGDTSESGEASAFNFWLGGSIRSGNQDAQGGAASFDFETDGLSLGVDKRLSSAWAIGAGVGYGKDESRVGINGTRNEGEAYTFALYSSYHPDQTWFFDTLVGYQGIDYQLRRYVSSNGNTVFGQRDATQWFASITVGGEFRNDRTRWSPYARWNVARATLDAYTESGDPIYVLAYDQLDVDTNTLSLGFRTSRESDVSWGTFAPQVRLEYQHDFQGDSTNAIQYAAVGSGVIYNAVFDGYNRNRWVLGLGANMEFESGWRIMFEFQGTGNSGSGNSQGFQFNLEKNY
jgi:large repetitive protein